MSNNNLARDQGIQDFRDGQLVPLFNGRAISASEPGVFAIRRLDDGLIVYIGRTHSPQKLFDEYERMLANKNNPFLHTKQYIPHSFKRNVDYEFVVLYNLPHQVRSVATGVRLLVNAKCQFIAMHGTQGRGQGCSDTGEYSNL